LENHSIYLWAYNIETVLAEKLETILSRVEINGRMRDFYDIYLIYTKDWKNINLDNFRESVNKTFSKRKYKENPFTAFDIIRNSDILRGRWNIYQNKYDYAKNIDFSVILDYIEKILKQLEFIET